MGDAFSTSLLIAFDVDENDYELGLSKIFFKPAKAAVLDTIMDKAGESLTKEQNDKITAYIVRKRCNQILGTVKAFTALRRIARMKRAEKQWREKGRIVSILGGTVMKHLDMARAAILWRKKKEAAVAMQTYFRSCYERKVYIKQVEKVKKATKIVQIAYDSMKFRQALKTWIDDKVEQRKPDDDEPLVVDIPVVSDNSPKTEAELAEIRRLEDEEREREREKYEKEKLKEIKALEMEKAREKRIDEVKMESMEPCKCLGGCGRERQYAIELSRLQNLKYGEFDLQDLTFKTPPQRGYVKKTPTEEEQKELRLEIDAAIIKQNQGSLKLEEQHEQEENNQKKVQKQNRDELVEK